MKKSGNKKGVPAPKTEKNPKGAGRYAHVPDKETRETVKRLSALGTRYADIATRLRISDETLTKYYKEELEFGKIDANAAVAGTLFSRARAGNMTAAIFWLKTQAGWKETQVNEIGGIDGKSIELSWADE